jgi:beta-lactam-binding protein with PASTA domain
MTYRRRRGLRRSRAPQRASKNGKTESSNPVDRGATYSSGGWKRWLGTAMLVAGLFFVGYLGAGLWLPSENGPVDAGPLVTVPELVGLEELEARQRLEKVGLEYGIRSTVTHSRAPEGAVLAQSPIPGQQVRPGAPVEVTLSRGPERHSVPDVSGLTARQASILLERLGFRVASETATHPAEAGRAIRTEPEAGTELTVPADVTLLVSRGSPLTTVPVLSGHFIDDARGLLEGSGLELGAISYDPLSTDPPGTIVGQYPPGGYGLRRGDPVEIRVAGRPRAVDRSRMRPMDGDEPEPDDADGSRDRDGPEEL